jgi:hypothetical protein
LKQLGERVLEQRQRSWFIGGLRQHLGEQPSLELDPHPSGRFHDRPFDLVRRQWHDGFIRRAHEVREAGIGERTIEEVGAECGDDPDARVRVRDERSDPAKEPSASRLVVPQREHLLELIDKHDDLVAPRRQDPLDRAQHAQLVPIQHVEETARGISGDP